MKISWRLVPAISQCADKRRPSWLLKKITTGDKGQEIETPYGAYPSIKAAKIMQTHLKRKPIELK